MIRAAKIPRPDDPARLLLDGLRALVRTQQVSERADVACCGMTVAQAATLQTLLLEGPIRLGALSGRLGVSPSTLTRNVERMEERGWVERVADERDGRIGRLRLTRSGRARARELERADERFAERLLGAVAPERRDRVLEGLLDLLEAIDRVTEGCCPERFASVHEFLDARRRASAE